MITEEEKQRYSLVAYKSRYYVDVPEVPRIGNLILQAVEYFNPPKRPRRSPLLFEHVIVLHNKIEYWKRNGWIKNYRRAYHQRSKLLHPDKGGEPEEFMVLQAHYEVLEFFFGRMKIHYIPIFDRDSIFYQWCQSTDTLSQLELFDRYVKGYKANALIEHRFANLPVHHEAELHKRTNGLSEPFQALLQQRDDLKAQVAQHEALQKEVADLKAQAAALQGPSEELKAEVKVLQEAKVKAEAQVQGLKAEVKYLEAEVDDLSASQHDLQDQVKELSTAKSDADVHVTELQSRIKGLKAQIKSLRQGCQVSGGEAYTLTKEVQVLEARNIELHKQIEALKKNKRQGREMYERLLKQSNTYHEQAVKVQQECRELQKEKAASEATVQAQAEELQAQAEDLHTAKKEVKAQARQAKSLKRKLDQVDSKEERDHNKKLQLIESNAEKYKAYASKRSSIKALQHRLALSRADWRKYRVMDHKNTFTGYYNASQLVKHTLTKKQAECRVNDLNKYRSRGASIDGKCFHGSYYYSNTEQFDKLWDYCIAHGKKAHTKLLHSVSTSRHVSSASLRDLQEATDNLKQ